MTPWPVPSDKRFQRAADAAEQQADGAIRR